MRLSYRPGRNPENMRPPAEASRPRGRLTRPRRVSSVRLRYSSSVASPCCGARKKWCCPGKGAGGGTCTEARGGMTCNAPVKNVSADRNVCGRGCDGVVGEAAKAAVAEAAAARVVAATEVEKAAVRSTRADAGCRASGGSHHLAPQPMWQGTQPWRPESRGSDWRRSAESSAAQRTSCSPQSKRPIRSSAPRRPSSSPCRPGNFGRTCRAPVRSG